MHFRSRKDLCGQCLRKYKSMFRWPQNGRSTSIAFKQGLNIDRRFKAVSRTLENKKIIMYSTTSELNSTFKTIGYAMADKMTATLEMFRFSPEVDN